MVRNAIKRDFSFIQNGRRRPFCKKKFKKSQDGRRWPSCKKNLKKIEYLNDEKSDRKFKEMNSCVLI